ncbi:MAG: hypothetical protein P4N60_07135 [Verrucomicrobiae bacterium]|nr:hypothetical protein [Verrucomicrobiae bacterium]
MNLHFFKRVRWTNWRRTAGFAVAVLFLLNFLQPRLYAATPALSGIASNCAAADEKFWRSCAQPPDNLDSRTLFAYALALCESKQHPERLDRLFELAAAMQDRDPQSRGYGNFHWYHRDTAVLDYNAVDFCMRGGALLWRKHREFIPEKARTRLREMLELATTGCLKHKVAESYSNIAIMNAGDLILLGETLDNPTAAAEGYARLDRVYKYAQAAGVHEFDSPTYTGVDLDGLGLVEAYCRQEAGRAQARALLEFLWTDIAANWFEPAQRLAGAHSRNYDFLHGRGYLDVELTLHGWLGGPLPRDIDTIYGAQSQWQPPEKLQLMAREFPRRVRQTWGREPLQFRTHYLLPDITLSCSASSYGGRMDMPLTVDLPGDRQSVRGYFIADGRDDPYGQKKISAGPHQKTLHLNPLWIAGQREGDALGLVIYRDKDIPTNTVALESSFVLPMEVDSFRIGNRLIHFTAGKSVREVVKPGEAVALRKGGAALALRVPWSREVHGSPAEVVLIYDGNRSGAVRLTVEQGTPGHAEVKSRPGAAFWVRIGTGLADDDRFAAWLDKFTSARAEAEAQAGSVKIQVAGEAGPVEVDLLPAGEASVTPPPAPARGVLEVNGVDVGSQIFGRQ